jgi:hypothetical protein
MNPESEQENSPHPTISDSSYRMRPSISPHLDQLTGPRSPTPQKVEESWEKPEKTSLPWTGWIITFAALTLLTIIIIYFGRTVSSESTMVEAVKENSKNEEKWHGPLPKDVAEQFISATTVEERLQFVRDPESIEPLLRDFYEKGPGAREKVVELNSLGGNTNETSVFNRYEVRLSDGSSRSLYVVLKDHRAYVDFKAYSRYGSASWADLLNGTKVEAAEVRVLLKVDRLFVGEFTDENKWLCFTVRTPDCDECLYFYADKNSEAAKHLAALKEDKLLRVTVAIRARSDSYKRKQFEITRYHASSWCY